MLGATGQPLRQRHAAEFLTMMSVLMLQRQGGRFTRTSLDVGNGLTSTSFFERHQLTGPEVSCAAVSNAPTEECVNACPPSNNDTACCGMEPRILQITLPCLLLLQLWVTTIQP